MMIHPISILLVKRFDSFGVHPTGQIVYIQYMFMTQVIVLLVVRPTIMFKKKSLKLSYLEAELTMKFINK